MVGHLCERKREPGRRTPLTHCRRWCAQSVGMTPSTTFTALAADSLPYPHGLGKSGPPQLERLERGMRQLLRAQFNDVATNREWFWQPEYQCLIQQYLSDYFNAKGDIVDIATAALQWAQTSRHFGAPLEGAGLAERKFIESLGPEPVGETAHIVREWTLSPPEVVVNADGSYACGDGRHRMSYLRACVQPDSPDFPVLVRLKRF